MLCVLAHISEKGGITGMLKVEVLQQSFSLLTTPEIRFKGLRGLKASLSFYLRSSALSQRSSLTTSFLQFGCPWSSLLMLFLCPLGWEWIPSFVVCRLVVSGITVLRWIGISKVAKCSPEIVLRKWKWVSSLGNCTFPRGAKDFGFYCWLQKHVVMFFRRGKRPEGRIADIPPNNDLFSSYLEKHRS